MSLLDLLQIWPHWSPCDESCTGERSGCCFG